MQTGGHASSYHCGGQGSSNNQCDNAHVVTFFLRGYGMVNCSGLGLVIRAERASFLSTGRSYFVKGGALFTPLASSTLGV